MSPRKYRLGAREASVEHRRRRIVEATFQLHGERGISATSMVDVAHRADVSLGTVYRHFPTLDDLVYACGQLVMEKISPPGLELLTAVEAPEERVRVLVREIFGMYERAGSMMKLAMADIPRVKALVVWFQRWAKYKESLVKAALGQKGGDMEEVGLLTAITGFEVWETLTARGMSSDESAELTSRAFMAWLDRRHCEKSNDCKASRSRRHRPAARKGTS